ncbi:MAG: MiaB/RimO family radical SAM methylthiotransferase [Gaiellaceae bacterium]
MASFSVDFLGCKVSYTDAQAVRERLLAGGLGEDAESAEIAVVNTCCVTHEAVRKSRKAARRAASRAERVYVTGCAANLENAFADLPDNVSVIAERSEQTPAAIAADAGVLGCTLADHRRERVRAFLKIQDGCSFSCSFCVVPQVRGPSRSRVMADVLGEAQRRASEGYREIVLSGINLGCYRDRETRSDLAALLRQLASFEGLDRIRLSSIEVNHLTQELVDTMRALPKVAPHLHVPLQSGDDGVLRDMARRYDVATYVERVGRAEGMNVTTDVIVGFPSEDEPAFERTLAAVAQIGATKVHVFPYSPRPGTATADADPVPPAIKRERSQRLRELGAKLAQRRWHEKVGTHDTVLVDRPGRGYGADYTPWLLDAPVGSFERVRAARVSDEGVVAA